MAEKTRGTAHLYGIDGTISGATVQDFKVKKQCQNEDSTVDESGNEIERRYDDLAQEATITVRLKASSSFDPNDPGETLSYGGVTYDIVSVEHAQVAKGFQTLVLNLKKTEYVS